MAFNIIFSQNVGWLRTVNEMILLFVNVILSLIEKYNTVMIYGTCPENSLQTM